MGSEEEKVSSFTPKLPLLSHAYYMQSPERSGMLTPPHHALASVPFRWEEEPGKPKPCTELITFSNPNDFVPKCLELPPRLLVDAKIPSPTTVLEDPYMAARARTQSSSFRIGSECYGSFRAAASGNCSPEMVPLGAMFVSKRGYKEKGFLGSWMRRALKSRREVGGNSCVFPSNSGDRDNEYSRELGEDNNGSTSVRITRIKRAGSFSSLAHSKPHFWASIYEGFKQVVPWSKRERKNGFMG